MATVLLSAASVAAISTGNPMAALGLNLAAQTVGQQLDGAMFGASSSRHSEGARLETLSVQSSTYGKMIPLVYGNVRLAGNVIWAQPIKEVATTTTTSQGGKGGGGGTQTTTSTSYSYTATLAIAICEGEVDEVQRVWADAKLLDISQGTYRFYKGSQTQLPDSLIESIEGLSTTPAYRGLAYVVIEDFPLADFGNRIPNFTFEVRKKLLPVDVDGEAVEEMVKSIIMIPGSGEFVYDTAAQEKISGELVSGQWVQSGDRESINQHNPYGKANSLLALDQLTQTCPNVEWVGVVVNWFGTSLNAGSCIIKPGVEYPTGGASTSPDSWEVGSYTRATAHQITYDGDSPRYGGTPDDASLLRYLNELKARGYNIFFYPMFLMDVTDKPWRGRVSGSTTEVANFFTKAEGYNGFITHYANLVKDVVDAFAIGSELKALTAVHNSATTNRSFPAVDALVNLAATVKGIVGSGVSVTYAADWSEYHHTDDGWYHMDKLWASPNIDKVGIDAYFPLTDVPQSELGYDIATIKQGWVSGEGYDWYYTDGTRTTQASLGAAYAWKNIDWWWNHGHINPDGNSTPWVPNSKPIWFTEFGFPSVDGATNQPNVFYDPTSSESYFPYHSQGRIDFRAQRAGIAATLSQWQDSDMIERLFLWTWDARPYPYWPDLTSVWADGAVWKTGHWVQGKLGISGLGAIIQDICRRAGLEESLVDVSRLNDAVDGYIVTRPARARELIEQLMAAYFFDAAESDGALKCVPRGQVSVAEISEDDLLPMSDGALLSITRAQEMELPREVDVITFNRLKNYQSGTRRASRQSVDARDVLTINLPIVMSEQQAETVAETALYTQWLARSRYVLELGMAHAALEPADVIEVTSGGATHSMRITQLMFGKPGKLRITAVSEDVAAYDVYVPPSDDAAQTQASLPTALTQMQILDIPALATDNAADATLRFACSGVSSNWKGAVVYRSDDGGGSYLRSVGVTSAAMMGSAVTALADGPTCVFDEVATVDVVLLGKGTLASASELAVLSGANLILIGNELLQFKTATPLSARKYRLSGLLRGRLGTEHATSGHVAGERVVLMDGRLEKDAMPTGLIGLPRLYKAVTLGMTLGSATAQSFTYAAVALKPYSPVHASGVRDGSGNLTISWVRRTRVGGSWRDYADVPLSEGAEAYEVDVLNGATVVRTLTSSSPSVVYLSAQQIADFGANQPTLSIAIYQLSQTVGRGYARAAVI